MFYFETFCLLQQYDNPLSKKFNDVVDEMRRERCSYLRPRSCQEGDLSGQRKFWYFNLLLRSNWIKTERNAVLILVLWSGKGALVGQGETDRDC